MDGIDSSNRAFKDACIHQYGPSVSMQTATDAHAIDSQIDSPISLQAIAKRSRSTVVLILCDAVPMTRHWNFCQTTVVSSSSPVFQAYRLPNCNINPSGVFLRAMDVTNMVPGYSCLSSASMQTATDAHAIDSQNAEQWVRPLIRFVMCNDLL